MHLRAWRKRDRECRRKTWVTVGAPELTVEGSARRLSAGLAGPDPRPKAACCQRLAIYGPVDGDGAARETLVQCGGFLAVVFSYSLSAATDTSRLSADTSRTVCNASCTRMRSSRSAPRGREPEENQY